MIAPLGMSLHTVQDFYPHANWPETQAPPAGTDYATVTCFDATSAQCDPDADPPSRTCAG